MTRSSGKAWLATWLESLWAAGFSALHYLQPTPVARWESRGDERVLVIAPHPDDEAAGAAGTIARHRRAGDRVTILTVSDGGGSRARGLEPARMAALRRDEAARAARALDVDLDWLGIPEGEWARSTLAPLLADRLATIAPTLIYAPSRVDFHPEHLAVAATLATVVGDGSRLRVYQLQVPLTAALTTLVCPLDRDAVERARAAFAAHASQSDSLARCWRMRRYCATRHRLRGLAEPFLELDGATYRALHGGIDGRVTPFRSLRPRAWSDPLAYLVGRGTRARLMDSG